MSVGTLLVAGGLALAWYAKRLWDRDHPLVAIVAAFAALAILEGIAHAFWG